MFRRLVSAVVVAALTLVAPGLPAWAAAGKSVSSSAGAHTAPMPMLGGNTLPNAAQHGSLPLTVLPSLSGIQTLSNPSVSGVSASALLPGASSIQKAQSRLSIPAGKISVPSQVAGQAAAANAVLPAIQLQGQAVNPALLPTAAQSAVNALPSDKNADPRASLNLVFDNSRANASAPNGDAVSGSEGSGQAPLDASSNQEAASAPVPPAPPTSGGEDAGGPGGPGGPKKPSLTVVLLLGAAGGVAMYFALPVVMGFVVPFLPVWIVAKALALKIGLISLGSLAGISASQRPTWAGFFGATLDAARSSGRMTFRFWARFGTVFHTVLTGGKPDEAMKKDLPGSIFKYSVGAWIFVVAGYVSYPVAATLGILYKVVATPIAGAWRGVKQILVEIFPWLTRLLEKIVRVVKRIIPLVVGGVWGLILGIAIPAGVGAFVAAKPTFTRIVMPSYTHTSLGGRISVLVLKFAALVLMLPAGAAGLIAGLLSAVLYAPTLMVYKALEWAGFRPKAQVNLMAWREQLEGDESLMVLADYDMGDESRKLTFGEGLTRLANLRFSSIHAAFAAGVWGWVAYFRAWNRVAKGAQRPTDIKIEIAPEAVIDLPAREPGFAGYLKAVKDSAKATSRASWLIWRSAGLRTDAALRYREPAKSLKDAILGWPAAVLGGVASVVFFVGGGLYEALVIPTAALYRLAARFAVKLLPALRAIGRFLRRAIVKFIPFTLGFVLGSAWGVLESAFAAGVFAVSPLAKIYDNPVDLEGWARWRYNAALVVLAIPALAVGLLNAAVGAVLGLPYALFNGFGLATRWSNASERYASVFKTWKRWALKDRLERVMRVNEYIVPAEANLNGWNAFVAGLNGLGHGLTGVFSWAPAGTRAAFASFKDARVYVDTSNRPELPSAPREERADRAAPQELPWQYPSYAATLISGLLFGTVGLFAIVYTAAPALLGITGLWIYGIWAAGSVAGLLAGVGLAQESLWKRFFPEVLGTAKASARVTFGYWSKAGAAFAASWRGTDRPEQDSAKLGWLHRLIGGVLAIPAALAGGVFGAVWLATRAVGHGVWQLVSEFLPALANLFRLFGRILKRIIPFVFGLGAGFVMGVVGSMTFGVLLLARPYFKHVVAEDFEYSGLGGFLHMLALKGVALVGGVIMGVLGLAVGLIVALPYAITLIPSTAFQLADIGGKSQKFFDLWSKGTLRAELRRVNALTNNLELPEAGTDRSLMNGWLRLANIIPATLAATVAGTIAGWVSYFRSIWNAGKALKSGQEVPLDDFDSLRGVWKSTGKGAKYGAKLGGFLGFGAAVVGALGWVTFGFGFIALWFGGWAIGIAAGIVLGAAFGLLYWLANQLEK